MSDLKLIKVRTIYIKAVNNKSFLSDSDLEKAINNYRIQLTHINVNNIVSIVKYNDQYTKVVMSNNYLYLVEDKTDEFINKVVAL